VHYHLYRAINGNLDTKSRVTRENEQINRYLLIFPSNQGQDDAFFEEEHVAADGIDADSELLLPSRDVWRRQPPGVDVLHVDEHLLASYGKALLSLLAQKQRDQA